jgi:transcription elongation factor Elf1
MNCPNCNAKLSCGCQKRTASDGKSVCSSCLSNYEQKLKQSKKP